MCVKPFRQGAIAFGCGQCLPCRLNRRRVWTARLMLEHRLHERSCFVTLTYNKEHVPDDGSLRPRDCQLFLKRLRARVYPIKVRYFLVGEYGERTFRPHYHALLFGVCDRDVVVDSWRDVNNEPLGFVHVGFMSRDAAAYCCQYVCKGWTKEVPELQGRCPEFTRMSLRPGIGAGAVEAFVEGFTSRGGAEFISVNGDVGGVFRSGGQLWPLGRYLKQRLRDGVGIERREALVASMTPFEKCVVRCSDDHKRDVSRARADYFRRERMKGRL